MIGVGFKRMRFRSPHIVVLETSQGKTLRKKRPKGWIWDDEGAGCIWRKKAEVRYNSENTLPWALSSPWQVPSHCPWDLCRPQLCTAGLSAPQSRPAGCADRDFSSCPILVTNAWLYWSEDQGWSRKGQCHKTRERDSFHQNGQEW